MSPRGCIIQYLTLVFGLHCTRRPPIIFFPTFKSFLQCTWFLKCKIWWQQLSYCEQLTHRLWLSNICIYYFKQGYPGPQEFSPALGNVSFLDCLVRPILIFRQSQASIFYQIVQHRKISRIVAVRQSDSRICFFLSV